MKWTVWKWRGLVRNGVRLGERWILLLRAGTFRKQPAAIAKRGRFSKTVCRYC